VVAQIQSTHLETHKYHICITQLKFLSDAYSTRASNSNFFVFVACNTHTRHHFFLVLHVPVNEHAVVSRPHMSSHTTSYLAIFGFYGFVSSNSFRCTKGFIFEDSICHQHLIPSFFLSFFSPFNFDYCGNPFLFSFFST